MIEQLKLLVKLQAVDKILHDLEQERNSIPPRIEDLNTAEENLKARLAAEQADLDDISKRRKDLEHDNDGVRARLRRAENRLMASKNQREYRAANAEIEEAKDAVKSNDDILLGFMEQQESLNQTVSELGTKLEEVSADAGKERKRLKKRMSTLKGECTRLGGKRGGLCDGVSQQLMDQYDFIRVKRQGVALAPVSSGTCQACNMELPPQQFNELQRMDKIMICPTCSRLIYWADAETFEDV